MGLLRRLALPIALVTLSFGAGYITDRFTGSEQTDGATGDENGVEARARARFESSRQHLSLRGHPLDSALDSPFSTEALTPDGAAVDARELFARALAADSPRDRSDLLYETVQALGHDELVDALEWADQVPWTDRRMFVQNIVSRIAERDPRTALAYAEENLRGQDRRNVASIAISSWMDQDPERATQWVLSQPISATRSEGLMTAISSFRSDDPERALELIGHLGADDATSAAVMLFSDWADHDRSTALDRISDLPSRTAQREARIAVSRSWSQEEPLEVLQWAESLPPSEAEEVRFSALLAYSESDPEAAFRAATMSPDVSERSVTVLAERLARNDPEEALTLVQSMQDGETQDSALQAVASVVAFTNPREAAHIASKLSEGPGRSRILHDAARELSLDNVQDAAAWAATLSTDEDRAAAYQGVVGSWAAHDPSKASRFVTGLSRGKSRTTAESELVHAWARSNPEEAAQWVQQHALSPEATASLVDEWIYTDREQAVEWLEELPSGEARDAAMSVVSASLNFEDPEEAWLWADRIEDPEERLEHLEGLSRGSIDNENRQNVDQMISGTDLSEVEVARLRGDWTNLCVCDGEEEVHTDTYDGDQDEDEGWGG